MKFRYERGQQVVDIRAGALHVRVRLHRIDLPIYAGAQPSRSWRKPVVGPPTRPFAEFQVVEGLEADGWLAAWVYRPGRFLSAWEPRVAAAMPEAALHLHDQIRDRGTASAGCWDVFAWRDGECLFAELKRGGSSDRIRESQLLWRESALRLGVSAEAFAIVEWYGGVFAEPTGSST